MLLMSWPRPCDVSVPSLSRMMPGCYTHIYKHIVHHTLHSSCPGKRNWRSGAGESKRGKGEAEEGARKGPADTSPQRPSSTDNSGHGDTYKHVTHGGLWGCSCHEAAGARGSARVCDEEGRGVEDALCSTHQAALKGDATNVDSNLRHDNDGPTADSNGAVLYSVSLPFIPVCRVS